MKNTAKPARSTASAVPPRPIVIHGVDFSGADSGGASKIRIAERELKPRSAVRVRGRLDRHGLRRAILESRNDGREHLWRIDAPFGLPLACFTDAMPEGFEEVLAGRELSWLAVAEWMSGFATPREWRAAMRDASRKEPKRTCDREFATPLAPMNLRVFKQTFTLIKEIALPLAREGVAIMPVSMPADGSTPAVRVCEGCPASVLKRREWPAKGYKGGGEPPRRVREELVRLLRHEGLEIPSDIAVEAINDEEGDLLDAIILTMRPFDVPHPPEALVEAWVY
ncbi:MAG: hypothetical protein RI967_1294 [Planctomycetota bacterium]